MTLDEFYDEVKREPKALPPAPPEVEKKATPASIDYYGEFDDEILPPDVFKAYVQGEICYMRITDDGRQIRVDDWNDTLPSYAG